MALKYGLALLESEKSVWFFRKEDVKHKLDYEYISSMLYHYTKDLQLLLPENEDKFMSVCEKLANAGMDKAIEFIENENGLTSIIENDILPDLLEKFSSDM